MTSRARAPRCRKCRKTFRTIFEVRFYKSRAYHAACVPVPRVVYPKGIDFVVTSLEVPQFPGRHADYLDEVLAMAARAQTNPIRR